MELASVVLAAGNVTVVLVVLGILSLAAIGGAFVVKGFTAPERPDHNEPRI